MFAPGLPEAANLQEHFPSSRTHGPGTVFDISPEIGHFFVAPVHESLFEQYQTFMNEHFPFVPISPTVSALAMMKDRPFLYTCCVMTAAHRDPPLQSRIARDILKHISERMILAGEKSLDFLQGLLIVTAWYHVYTHNNPQLMNLLHLAKALLIDLGLNRPPGFGIFQIKMSSDATEMIHGSRHDARTHSLEERRACLGIYHVYHRYNAAFRRLDPITWSEHFETCCQALQNAAEYPSDTYAVALVRLDHILERYTSSGGFKPGSSMPIPSYIKLFSEELNRLRQELSSVLLRYPAMLADIQTAEITLFEPTISANCDVPAHKVEAYHACLKSCLTYFEAFMNQDVAKIPFLPFLSCVTMAHALDVVARLSFTHDEGWDPSYVRSVAGFDLLSDKIVTMLKSVQAHEEATYPISRSIRFTIFSMRIQKFRQWYDSKLQHEASSQQQGDSEPGASNEHHLDSLDTLPGLNDFSDMLWQDYTMDWSRLENEFGFS